MLVSVRNYQQGTGLAVLALLVLLGQASVHADNGGFVDLTFECDVTITCPTVCAVSIDACPNELKCSGAETLCNDGSCATFCDPSLPSICAETSLCAPVTCASIDTFYDSCKKDFGPWYEFAITCSGVEVAAIAPQEARLTWTKTSYIVVYLWVSTLAVAIVSWCWYNQRLNPIEGSSVTIQGKIEEGTRMTYQTAYKRHFMGSILHMATMVTFFGWFALQTVCTRLIYTTDGEDLLMSLRTFIVVWFAGYLWNCSLLWPHSIESVFLRRCIFAQATHIAVFQETDESLTPNGGNADESTRLPACFKIAVAQVKGIAHNYFSLLFANPDCRPDLSKGIFQFCPVLRNDDQSQYITFLLRRYNFDSSRGLFLPGSWALPKTFKELASSLGISVLDQVEAAYYDILKEDNPNQIEEHLSSQLYKLGSKGLSTAEVNARYRVVGPNVMEIPAPSLLGIFMNEIAKPFYLFQIYIIWFWATIQYMYGTFIIWTIVFITACIISWFRYRGGQVLHAISHVDDQATVLRDGQLITIDQFDLVPGDVVRVTLGPIHCDMLLMTGQTVVDESALTGEATPQVKSPVEANSERIYDPAIHKRQTLSAGTSIVECDDSFALVMKTASNTTKGELLRHVLVFRNHQIKFRSELPVVISLLTTYSAIFCATVLISSGAGLVVGLSLGMVAFANAFPALLPTTFIIPVGFAFERLTRKGVACSNSDSILIAGSVNVAFFDKTGTLTKQGLAYISTRSAESWTAGQWTSETMIVAMAVCHSLTSSETRTLIGNPVDRAMFEASRALLLEASGATAKVRSANEETFTILRRFDFDHNRMTQSVIVRLPNGGIRVFVKGSGERIGTLCAPGTVPDDYMSRLKSYSRRGVYQLGVATKDLGDLSFKQLASMTRDQVESDLVFAGVLNFANQMREDTPEVIKQLSDADVQSIMLTGDNLFTGIHIARKSGLIASQKGVIFCVLDDTGKVVWKDEDDVEREQPEVVTCESELAVELAISGEAWQVLLSQTREYAISMAPSVRVFGRCSPNDKVSVVDTFTGLGFTTMMCGDGGNDCGALKAAHIGLALSDGDASIVAPLTSLKKDIADVLTVLKEGRAALSSTMAAYKYVIMYGNISSYCQLIMYALGVSFSDWQWLFVDVVWTVPFTLTLPLAKHSATLSKARPTSSLLSLQTVGSVLGINVINYAFMAIALVMLNKEDWFQCRKLDNAGIIVGDILSLSDNYEISVVWLMVGTQLISSAISFNFGYEYRQSWYRNYVFAAFAVGYAVMHIWATLIPGSLSCLWRINCDNDHIVRGVVVSEPSPIANPFNSTIMPSDFRFKLLGVMLANGCCITLYEFFVVNGLWQRRRLNQHLAQPAIKNSQPPGGP